MKTIAISTVGDQQIIHEAVAVLRSGGLIVYPTETVYGLGVDATNQQAVDTLLKFKGQRGEKPVLIAVSDQQMAEEYVDVNDVARRLYRTFLPGPVAVVSRIKKIQIYKDTKVQNKKPLAQGIASIDGTVGVRIPAYPLVLKIIKQFGKPITSTSANTSGSRNPWYINDIKQTTLTNKFDLIDLILDAGQLPKRPPSTVIDTSREKTEIVREGEVKIGLKVKGQRLKEERYISHSPEETMNIAKRLMNGLFRPSSFIPSPSSLVLALQGPLGAGKTVFAKGVARALGINDPIRSPSYALVREYSLSEKRKAKSGKLFHIDAWRLSDPSEFQDLGLDRMLKPGNIVVIEWMERLSSILSSLEKSGKVIFVQINVMSDHERNIKITM